MRSLKKRPRVDNHVNQGRAKGSSAGRWIYLIVLTIFLLSVANYLWGDLVMLRGDGLVLRDKRIVAVSHLARIEAVEIAEADAVDHGDVILRIESMELLERLAELSTRHADLTQRAADFQLRMQVAEQLLPLAQQLEKQTEEILGQVDTMRNQGILTSARYEEILRTNFQANADLVRLMVEKRTLTEQMDTLEAARIDAALALKNLKSHYGDGIVRAPASGTVSARIPAVGAVFRPGDPILEIYVNEAYVLTYLPRRYLFSIEKGMKVKVTSGRQQAEGVIDAILPVSDMLPEEFQNSFKPRERNQLAKIRLVQPERFPVFEKVQVSHADFW